MYRRPVSKICVTACFCTSLEDAVHRKYMKCSCTVMVSHIRQLSTAEPFAHPLLYGGKGGRTEGLGRGERKNTKNAILGFR